VPVIDHLFAIRPIRKAIWRLWYPFLTRRLRQEDVLFLNYAFEEEPPMRIPLRSEDEPNRACIQLYHHVAAQVPFAGREVLEVSCGHGGGAAYLTRTFQPQLYTALDLNPTGINFCRQRHREDRLSFVQGDAGKLPFAASAFDTGDQRRSIPLLSRFSEISNGGWAGAATRRIFYLRRFPVP
jgi:SAM-dependent methyltransferase